MPVCQGEENCMTSSGVCYNNWRTFLIVTVEFSWRNSMFLWRLRSQVETINFETVYLINFSPRTCLKIN